MFEADEVSKGIDNPILGPSYFAARKTAERFMASFEAEHFKPLIDEFTEKFRDELWSNISEWLLMDTESNLQGEMWTHVDNMVKHVLAGDEWAIKKFALGERYDCERIRKTLASYIPKELQDARISDLESEVDRLTRDIKFLRDL